MSVKFLNMLVRRLIHPGEVSVTVQSKVKAKKMSPLRIDKGYLERLVSFSMVRVPGFQCEKGWSHG